VLFVSVTVHPVAIPITLYFSAVVSKIQILKF